MIHDECLLGWHTTHYIYTKSIKDYNQVNSSVVLLNKEEGNSLGLEGVPWLSARSNQVCLHVALLLSTLALTVSVLLTAILYMYFQAKLKSTTLTNLLFCWDRCTITHVLSTRTVSNIMYWKKDNLVQCKCGTGNNIFI